MTHKPLMPRSTALWLVDNTSISFEQIADFCGLHTLEIQAIADGDVLVGPINFDPIAQHQISKIDLKSCENNPLKRLNIMDLEESMLYKKRKKYSNVSRRRNKPNAILWLLKNHSKISDSQICALLRTTKVTIKSIREKSHWNIKNIRSQSPVSLSLCSEDDLKKCLNKIKF